MAPMLPIAVSLTRLQFFMSNGDGLNPITTADNTVGPLLVDCYQILIVSSTYCKAAKRSAFQQERQNEALRVTVARRVPRMADAAHLAALRF